jgi:phosphoribosylanthranilate isomerase
LLIDSADASDGFLRLGGTGKVADWQAAAAIVEKLSMPVFIAGGINPDNVEEALIRLRPYGVDLCSGVEAAMGKKDPEKVRALVSRFKTAVERIEKGEA